MCSHAALFIAAPDNRAAVGTRLTAAPHPNTDPAYIAGESGAAGLGLLHSLKTGAAYQALCGQAGLDDTASVLIINTEGDTSPDIYQRIVWHGEPAYAKKMPRSAGQNPHFLALLLA